MSEELVTVPRSFVLALAEAVYVRYEILAHLAHKKSVATDPAVGRSRTVVGLYQLGPPGDPPLLVALYQNDEDRRRLIGEILASLLWSWNNDR